MARHDDFTSLALWSQKIHDFNHDILVNSSSARDRARLRCISGDSAGVWLEPCPIASCGLSFTPAEFSILSRWWLGLNLVPVCTTPYCTSCGDAMDAFGDHALCCKKAGMIERHTHVVQFFWHLATAAGLHVDVEVRAGDNLRPADLLLSHWKGGGPLAVDVSISHPLAPSRSVAAVLSGNDSANEAERDKHTKYDSVCQAAHLLSV